MTASTMAIPVWDHDGTPISSYADGCSDSDDEDSKGIFVSLHTEPLGRFVSRHSAVLHMCGASPDNAGSFRCAINGTTNELGLFSVSVKTKGGRY